MGVVYEAEQQELGRRVALKVLANQAKGGEKAIARFRSEARAAARMHHTNIVPVFDVGQEEDCVFYAMQLIQGQSLDRVIDDLRLLRRRSRSEETPHPKPATRPQGSIAASMISGQFNHEPLAGPNDSSVSHDSDVEVGSAMTETVESQRRPESSASLPGDADVRSAETDRKAYFLSVARIGLQTARALAYSHERGIIHRDIKPSNLILDAAGVVWVTDFGLAKTGDSDLTHTGDILGTLRYMSPERFKGRCDVRADIYSLGLTLYEMLMLEEAFNAHDHLNLIDRITKVDPPSPRSRDIQIPQDLETIVLKSIDKDPKSRYQSADEMADDLDRFVHDEPIRARRATAVERFARWSRRNRGTAASLVAVAALLLFGIVGSATAAFHYQRQEQIQRQLKNDTAVLAERERQSRFEAQQAQKLAERSVYLSDVRLALELLDSDDEGARQVSQKLEAYADSEEQHGFMWHYVRNRMDHDNLIFQHPVDHLDDRQIDLAFGVNGKLISLSRDGLMLEWGEIDKPLGRFDFANGLDNMMWAQMSPAGDRVAVVDSDRRLHLFDRQSKQRLDGVLIEDVPLHLQFLSDGSMAVFVTGDPEGGSSSTLEANEFGVLVWNADDEDPIGLALKPSVQPEEDFVKRIRRFPDHQTDEKEESSWEWNVRAMLERQSLSYLEERRLFAPMYSGSGTTSIVTDQESKKHRIGGPNLHVGATSRDGSHAVLGQNGGMIQVLRLDSGTEADLRSSVAAHGGAVFSLSFSADAKLFASGGSEGSVTVWNLEDSTAPRLVRRVKGHQSNVLSVRISPDKRRIASASNDGRIVVGDLQPTGGRSIGREDHEVVGVDLSPAGNHVAFSGAQCGTQL